MLLPSLTLRSSLCLRRFTSWTETRPQPLSWPSTPKPWWRIHRPAPSRISPPDREDPYASQRTRRSPSGYLCVLKRGYFGFCAFRLYKYVDESTLFSRPTYAALLNVLDNYKRITGEAESFTSQQLTEQETFLKETMLNTELGRELFAFLYTKGNVVVYLNYSTLQKYSHPLTCRFYLTLSNSIHLPTNSD